MRSIRRIAPVFVLALVLALPAASHAAKTKTYNVTFKGSGTFKREFDDGLGNTTHTAAAFNWKSAYRFYFEGLHFGTTYGYYRKKSSYGGDWSNSETSSGGVSCSGSGRFGPPDYTPGVFFKRKGGTLTLGVEAMSAAGPTSLPSGANDCATGDGESGPDFWNHVIINSGVGLNAPAVTPAIKITKSKLKRRTITFKVKTDPKEGPPPTCGAMCTQSYGWSGTITLTRASR